MTVTPEQLATIGGVQRVVTYLEANSIPVPDELVTVLAVYAAAQEHTAVPPAPTIEALYTATDAKTIRKAIDELIEHKVRADARESVRPDVEQVIHRRVRGAVGRCAVEMIDSIVDTFDEAAESFVAAYRNLPADISPDALISAGGDTVDSYHAARGAADRLDELRKLRRALQQWVEVPARRAGLVLATALIRLDTADQADTVGNLWKSDGPLAPWSALVDQGAKFHWSTVAEQRAAIAKLDDPEPLPKKPSTGRQIGATLPEPARLG